MVKISHFHNSLFSYTCFIHEKLYESPSIRLQNDNAPKNVVWGRTWYVSTNAMLYCISHYYTRLLQFVIKDVLKMPTSTLNKYAKKKGMQNKLLENGKDGNDMIFFCHYIVPLAEFETPRNDKFTVYREIKIQRKLLQVYPIRFCSCNLDLIFLW